MVMCTVLCMIHCVNPHKEKVKKFNGSDITLLNCKTLFQVERFITDGYDPNKPERTYTSDTDSEEEEDEDTRRARRAARKRREEAERKRKEEEKKNGKEPRRYRDPCEYAMSAVKTVPSLHRLCRATVRNTLSAMYPHSNLFVLIPQLNLPESIHQYLLYYVSLHPLFKISDGYTTDNSRVRPVESW